MIQFFDKLIGLPIHLVILTVSKVRNDAARRPVTKPPLAPP